MFMSQLLLVIELRVSIKSASTSFLPGDQINQSPRRGSRGMDRCLLRSNSMRYEYVGSSLFFCPIVRFFVQQVPTNIERARKDELNLQTQHGRFYSILEPLLLGRRSAPCHPLQSGLL